MACARSGYGKWIGLAHVSCLGVYVAALCEIPSDIVPRKTKRRLWRRSLVLATHRLDIARCKHIDYCCAVGLAPVVGRALGMFVAYVRSDEANNRAI